MGLYKEIQSELQQQGHQVTYIEEPKRAVSVYSKNLSFIRIIKKIYVEKTKYYERYWKKRINKEKLFSEKYDVFFCVNGMSFHPILIHHLRKTNPQIKTSLYIWDSNETFDYFRNVRYFDKAYSFDLKDVNNYDTESVEFLPFYWPKELEMYDGAEIKYGVFSVGSLHDDRLFVYKNVIDQLEKNGISYYIKLIVNAKAPSVLMKIRAIWLRLSKNKKELDNYLVLTGQKTYPFVSNQRIEPLNMTRYISQSKMVLDTDVEIQGGVTPRLIWAMASNKIVCTTNRNIVDFPFYKPEFFQIIDRRNPCIDLKRLDNNIDSRKAVYHLRIDRWVNNFI